MCYKQQEEMPIGRVTGGRLFTHLDKLNYKGVYYGIAIY